MKTLRSLFVVLIVGLAGVSLQGADRAFDPELVKRLGADERGMKTYVLCILKTGPKDAAIKGVERDAIFAGHFANIGRLAEEGKLAWPVPSGRTIRRIAGSTSSMS